ncbi:MAG: hypothetical protein IJW49_07110 [Clostridia bacterium]|nr:hypothetical protein [Clostridia bacterium]
MKKVLALVLTLAMVLSMFTMGLTASAETAKPADAPSDAIAIGSVAELKTMAAGKYYYLTTDLTFGSAGTVNDTFSNTDAGPSESDYATKPVEESLITIPAGATLDGNGHTIYQGYYLTNPGMYTETESYTSSLAWTHAMFKIADGNAVTVKNLKFGSEADPIRYSENGNIYGIFADSTANTDVTFDNITIWGYRGDRGLASADMGLLMKVAAGYIQVLNSRVESKWVSAGGGIGGFFYTTGTTCTLEMTDCVSNARLLGTAVAGMLTTTNYCNETTESATLSFIRCANTYTAETLSGTEGVGGLLWNPGGAYCTVYMKDCENYANISLGNNLGAGIVGRVNTLVGALELNNCVNYGNVTSTKDVNSNYGMGGVTGHVGANNFTLINCENHGAVKGSGNLGAIVGRIDNAANGATLSGCKNYGSVKNTGANTTGDTYIQTAAGIVGQVNGTGTPSVLFENCVNYGAIHPGTTYAAAAGIVSAGHGKSHTWTLNNCKNFGAIGGSSSVRRAGGLVGYTIYAAKMSVNNCENYGTVTSTEYSGGIACYLYQGTGYDYTFTGCKNFGTVQGYHIVGGIIGKVGHVITSLVVDKCLNAGTVKPLSLSSGESIGGIVAWISNASVGITVKNCVNTGEVHGSTKNSQAYGAYGDTFGQIVGSYGRTATLNYADNPYVGGFIDWSAEGAQKVVLTNCYAYGSSVLGSGAKSMTGWIIGYDNEGVPTVYSSTADYTTSTVDATIPNGGAYGITVAPADGSTVYYLADTTSAEAAKKVTELLGVPMMAGAEDEPAVVAATPEIRGYQVSTDKTAIRFAAIIASRNYEEKVGFRYTLVYNGTTVQSNVEAVSKEVWVALNAAGEDGSIETRTAAQMGGRYITALTFRGVPATGTLQITVTPIADDFVGEAYVATIVDGTVISVVKDPDASANSGAGSSVTVSGNESDGIIINAN